MAYFALFVLGVIFGVGALYTALATARIEAAHPPSGRFVAVTNGRLHVVDLAPSSPDGGPTVVLIHGASGNAADLRLALGDRLARHRRVILIDRPGHGWSDRPGGAAAATPARQAALIGEALDHMEVSNFVMLGYSLGGAVAVAFALAYPERLAGLVLLAPVTHPWVGGLSWYNTLLSTPIIGPLFARTLALPAGELRLHAGAASVFAPQAAPDGYLRRAAIRLLLRPSQFIANAQDLAVLKDAVAAQVPRYGTIRIPTVVITGAADTVVSPEIHSRAFAAAVPNARLIVLDGIGHTPQHVAVDAVVAAVEALPAGPPLAQTAQRGDGVA